VKDFGLVVIGAHFGVWLNDKIIEHKNNNILLVEPVPYNYTVLKKKFSESKNIHICTNAVFSINQKKSFYFVKENSIPKLGKHWASGIGSFDKQHILNHKSKRFQIAENDIENIEIDFITFQNLIDKYQIGSIDNLQIDVEGAEFEILNSIDFKKNNIRSIQFEAKHFDGTFSEGDKLENIKEKLKNNGFELMQIDKENILAKKTIAD
jgi:FkbM family methyltransferase